MQEKLFARWGLGAFFSQAFIYGLSTMCSRLLTYLLVPFYTQVLDTPTTYGLLNELYSYAALINIIYLYGLETTYLRHASKQEAQVFGRLCGFIWCAGILSSAALALCAPALATHLGYGPGGALWIRLFALIFLLDAVMALPFARLRLKGRAGRFFFLRLLYVGVNVGLNLWFLWGAPLGVAHAKDTLLGSLAVASKMPPVQAVLLANVFAAVVVMPFFVRDWKALLFPTWTFIRPMLSYGLPLVAMGVVGVGIETLPRVVFRHFYPLDQQSMVLGILGQYAAAAKLAVFLSLAFQAYRYAADPLLLSLPQTPNYPLVLRRLTRLFLLCASPLCVAISLHLTPLAMLLLRQDTYRTQIALAPVLLYAYLFMGLYYHVGMWYKRLSKTQYGFYFSAMGLLITALWLVFAIPALGVQALAWGFLLPYALMAWAAYAFGQRHQPLNYHLSKPLALSALGAGIVLFIGSGLSLLPSYHWWFSLVSVLYALLCVYVLSREEGRKGKGKGNGEEKGLVKVFA